MADGASSLRYVVLFGLGLFVSSAGLILFFLNVYIDYTRSFVFLSPGDEVPLFFTPAVIIVLILYGVITLILVIALVYSWRAYRALAPLSLGRKEQLAQLRENSPFFRKQY